jgi:hypothetical protein
MGQFPLAQRCFTGQQLSFNDFNLLLARRRRFCFFLRTFLHSAHA